MKANLLTRLIIDEENKKAYLSVEGKIENATEEEKKEFRDKLVRAFSYILGLDESVSKAELLEDFEAVDESHDDEVPEYLCNVVLEKKAEQGQKEQKEEKLQEQTGKQEEPKLKIGKYPDLTPSQVVAKYGDKGLAYLKMMLPVYEKRASKFPVNRVIVQAIKKVLGKYAELSFDEMTEAIEWKASEDMEGFHAACREVGIEDYKEAVKQQNEEAIFLLYKKFVVD